MVVVWWWETVKRPLTAPPDLTKDKFFLGKFFVVLHAILNSRLK